MAATAPTYMQVGSAHLFDTAALVHFRTVHIYSSYTLARLWQAHVQLIYIHKQLMIRDLSLVVIGIASSTHGGRHDNVVYICKTNRTSIIEHTLRLFNKFNICLRCEHFNLFLKHAYLKEWLELGSVSLRYAREG